MHPGWVMRTLIFAVVTGFPVALLLAWFFEIGPGGISRDRLPEGEARPKAPGIRRYADLIIIGVLLVTVIVLLARETGILEEEAGPPVVGVLPFTEFGGPSAETYFGDGLADTLTYKLGQLQQLIVLAPSSTMAFRDPTLNLMEVGAKLGATALLQGTVRRTDNLPRVNARLADTATGQQLWAGSFDRPSGDLFAVQDEVAQSVSAALSLVLSPGC